MLNPAAQHHPETLTADPSLLQRNLVALSLRSPWAAREVAQAQPRTDLWLTPTPDGVPGGGLSGQDVLASILGASGPGAGAAQLASRHHPLAEAANLIETLDLASVATPVVLGFGLGHHVRLLSERLREYGLVVVFEPDVGLLRAVLQRVDCASWLTRGNVVVLTRADDTAQISEATRNSETLLALGTRLLQHPPSMARLGTEAERFANAFTGVLKAARTHIVTTLVQTEITVRNLLQNLDHYATRPGIDDLAGRCAGRPAIVVSAGPSLARNIDLLAHPGVRDRFVIVAAQTVLKQLLARGIKPHFVTALDHHEISRRFYEGLTPTDVDGVTLIAEPKANAAILSSFPGRIRCVGDGVLDRLLGPELSAARAKLPPGATVAHLAYYTARHLGCDPVVLVGQDLGFTDGQYYAAGAAIHNVWACELSEFNTLEMLEWQRIVRMKSLLRRVTDQQGRPIYTDEQMHTYLVQFERDFAADAARGLSVLDATEGGVAKAHTRPVPLADVIASFADAPIGPEPDPLAASKDAPKPGIAPAKVRARVELMRAEVFKLGELSRRTVALLESMQGRESDQSRVNSLIRDVYELRDRVQKLESANWFVHFLNQCGTFRRLRADRAIAMSQGLSPEETQSRQIERDLSNVRWLADASEQAATLLDDCLRALAGAAKITRDDPGREEDLESARVEASRRHVAAIVSVDPLRSCFGTPRDLARPIAGDRNALQLTLERLARCKEVDSILVCSPDPEACRRIAGAAGAQSNIRIEFVGVDAALFRRHQCVVRGARLWSRTCWRGGLGNLTGADEVFCAKAIAPLLKPRAIDSIAVVGGDWPLLDASLTDEVIARHRESPSRNHVAFTQAPPGIAPMVLERTLAEELAGADHPFASLGGVLGYIPIAPQSDPIARAACVSIAPALRDLPLRLVVDSDNPLPWLTDATQSLAHLLDSPPSVRHVHERSPTPEIVHVNINPSMPLELIGRIADECAQQTDCAVTLIGGPTPHPHLLDIVSAFRHAGVAGVHVRANIDWPREVLQGLLDAHVEVLSIDVADPRRGLDTLESLRQAREKANGPGLPTTWIVPRLIRCDAVYETIEAFYDACLMGFGACVIDPLSGPTPDERIQPLPIPASTRARLSASIAMVDVSGEVSTFDGLSLGRVADGSLARLWNGPRKNGQAALAGAASR